MDDGIAEGDEAGERVGGNRVFGRVGAGCVSAGALIGEDPEVEFCEEAGEVLEGLSRLGE